MRTIVATGVLVAGLAAALPAQAADIGESADADDKTMEQCLQAALDIFGGQALNVEYKHELGQPIYDFDILAPDGVRWEIEVNAENAMVWEIEREVEKTDPAFASQASVDEATAVQTALT
ncbi:MAG: peptidase, partial [Alphaproteobacteria bacterium]|nr:peptidase [Alphaproteobacteria bacterium]